VVNKGNVVDCAGNVVLANQCGVYRNYSYDLVDQNETVINATYQITELFSAFSSTIPGDTIPSTMGPITILAGSAASDTQYTGFTTSSTHPMCLASNDHDSFRQTFSVTLSGKAYPLTTTIGISRGRFSGTYEVNNSITRP
jgi:hypothetical protein